MEIVKNNTFDYYQIKSGDDLNSVIQEFAPNVVVRNNPNTDLYVGEVVKIVNNHVFVHVVKPMENLQTIASNYETTVDKLVKINGLKSTRIFVGQRLKI